MARLTHISNLKLDNWKNFRAADAGLRRLMFIVGANASGKSNFLDSMRFVRDIVTVGGGFAEAVRKRGGVSALRCLSARRYPDIGITVTVATSDPGEIWKYQLHFKQDNRQRPLVTRETVSVDGKTVLSRPNPEDESDPARLSQTYLEQVNVNKDFRLLVEFFSSIRYYHIVPQLVREPERSVAFQNDPFGGDFLEQLAKTNSRTQQSRLRRIAEALRVAVPQLESLELVRDPDRGTPHLRGRYSHWRPSGAFQSEDQFSDGTLRLVGLLWALMDGAGPLLLEEPELSLHPEVVRVLPQVFHFAQRRNENRQVLLSTHSPDLLSDTGISPSEVLLLEPSDNGTATVEAERVTAIVNLVGSGLSIGEAALPRTRPRFAEQLPFIFK